MNTALLPLDLPPQAGCFEHGFTAPKLAHSLPPAARCSLPSPAVPTGSHAPLTQHGSTPQPRTHLPPAGQLPPPGRSEYGIYGLLPPSNMLTLNGCLKSRSPALYMWWGQIHHTSTFMVGIWEWTRCWLSPAVLTMCSLLPPECCWALCPFTWYRHFSYRPAVRLY